MKKNENKQKEDGVCPFIKKNKLFPVARAPSIEKCSITKVDQNALSFT